MVIRASAIYSKRNKKYSSRSTRGYCQQQSVLFALWYRHTDYAYRFYHNYHHE